MNESVAGIANEHLGRRDGGTAERVFGELTALARLTARSHYLSKALADIDTPAPARMALLGDVTKGTLADATIELVVAVGGERSVDARVLAGALVEVAAVAAFSVAEQAGELEAVENGLFDFAAAVRGNGELRDVLTNPGVSDEAKLALVSDLLDNRVDGRAVELVRTIVAVGHGRDADEQAWQLGRLATARRGKLVAEVRSAVSLDEGRRSGLVAAISAAVGRAVDGRFTVDPSLVGSVVVRVGDEVFDGSVRHRLDQARKALVNS